MSRSAICRLAVSIIVAGSLAGCANTIRGVGKDAANAVDATQSAGRDISRSTY
ncbi:entericidin [Nitratireductor sp. GISD-1A_MAKvit]|uniref:entericidin domain-containing protein n=1 Tax=Nitratireductor sp. GISD-1A_MAKvit TaxID=3234198 RepID=UPI003466193B